MTQREVESRAPSPSPVVNGIDRHQRSQSEIWRILVVDDDEMVCRVSARMLHKSEVIIAESGAEACRLLEDRAPEEIDCVLLDMKMPGLTFEESFEEIRRICPEIPVIACSGNGPESLRDDFTGVPGTGYLAKPFTRVELEEAIGRAVLGPFLNG